MKVTCQACSAKYTIADDKVKGRKVKIRCKGCGTPIVVDGQNAPVETSGSASEAPPTLDPFAAENALDPAESDVWNVNLSESDSRTMSASELVQAFHAGVVTPDAFVWKEGMGDWQPILECAELAALLTSAPSPQRVESASSPNGARTPLFGASTSPAATGASRAASVRAQVAPSADLFGSLAAAGSEESEADIASSARAGLPASPGSTAYDDKLTGQRNENSVLFSLDAMKAGFGGAAPAEPVRGAPARGAPRSVAPPPADDPFGMGGVGGGLAGLGGGSNSLFNLRDNQALLTAPAPPEPPKQVAYAAPAPLSAPADKKRPLLLFGGAAVGVVVVGLAGLLMFGGGQDDAAPLAAASEAEGANAGEAKSAAAAAEVAPTAKPEEKAPEPAPAPSAEAKPAEEKPAEAKPEEHAASSTSKPATKKKEEEPAPAAANAPPFSKASAISALTAASNQSGSCRKSGGPTGSGKVQVTFAPSGRVTTATVMGPPFAGTGVGGCVASAFRRAKVPAFSGNPVTVSKSFSIN